MLSAQCRGGRVVTQLRAPFRVPLGPKGLPSWVGGLMPAAGRWRLLQSRLVEAAVLACQVADQLPRSPLGIHISGQLIRSSTAPAPGYAEAQGAESRRDFVHKMRICLKELRETEAWLQLIDRLVLVKQGETLERARGEVSELIAIFTRSVLTASRGRLETAENPKASRSG